MNPIRSMILIMGLSAPLAFSAPYHGDTLTLGQPDGTTVKVRCWGDEFYHRVESLDGYTLTQDPQTRWIQYARLSDDGKDFISTGVNYVQAVTGSASPSAKSQGAAAAANSLADATLDVPKHLDLTEADRRLRRESNRSLLGGAAESPKSTAPSKAKSGTLSAVAAAAPPTVGNILGLTLLIDFPDNRATVPLADIDNFLNQTGYTGGGNNGSVHDYYYDVSGGKLNYKNSVAAYYTSRNNEAYYTDPAIPYGQRARELIKEALDNLEAHGFDFSTLSLDESNNIRAINAFYAGYRVNAWAQGIWPHQGGMYGDFNADGVHSGVYEITDIGSAPSLGTFCHENGHMLFGWPDLYDTGYESNGVGNYDLMAYYGGSNNPVPPDPYLRALVGWETVTVIPSVTVPAIYTHTANTTSTFRYNNPAKDNEFFLIESRLKTGRNTFLPDEGLLIWHIDQFGYNGNEQRTPDSHYQVSVEQADGSFDLERGMGYGKQGDLFRAGYKSEFADWTLPDSKWWAGDSSGLNVVDVGPLGPSMSFTVQRGQLRSSDIGNPGQAGSTSQAGDVITVKGGGADVWNAADQCFFRYASLRADGEVIARVTGVQNTDAWAKAGVMIRETLNAGSTNAFIALTPGNGITFQDRPTANGASVSVKVAGTVPRWVKIERRRNLFTAYYSANGIDWTVLGSATIPMAETVFAGLAVTAHNNALLATGTFDNFQVVPSPWTATDVGTPAQAGSYALKTGAYTVKGGGADVWGTSDNFYYMRQPFPGDGRITARVASLVQTDVWAKAGVMIRGGADANSNNAFMAITAANGATYQRRPFIGGVSTSVSKAGIAAPRWVRLERRGPVITGLQSADGKAWSEVGHDSGAGLTSWAGLAVTSHNNAQLTTAVFDQVDLENGFPSLYASSTLFQDTQAGNGDGDVNPGEEINLNMSVYNSGVAAAKAVNGVLSSSDECVTLLSTTGAFGDVAANQSSAAKDFRFKVSAGCPSGHSMEFNLALTDSYGDVWNTPVWGYVIVRTRISGTVKSPAGPAPANAFVNCYLGGRFGYNTQVQPDGSYLLDKMQGGTYSCTAGADGYFNTAPISVTVPPDGHADFILSRPEVTLDRAGFSENLNVGQTKTVPLKITNSGDASLDFKVINPQAGYTWRNSDEAGGPAYVWTDIKATGTRLAMNAGMSGAVSLPALSFGFPFYGMIYNSMMVSAAGYLGVEDHYPYTYNQALPSPYAPGGMIGGFWDELTLGAAGAIYFQDYGDRAVFQYQEIQRQAGTGIYTFQIVIYKDGGIRFYYKDMGPSDGATIGMQNRTGDLGFSIAQEQAYVHNAMAVEIRPVTKDWLTVTPQAGTLAPKASATVTVGLDASGIAAGTFKGWLTLTHNAPHQTPFTLPATLTVQGSSGGVRRELWSNIPGTQLTDLFNNAAYPKSPTATNIQPSFEGPRNAAENYGERLRGYITAPATGDYTFFISGDDNCELRLSTDDHPGRAVAIARVSTWTTYRNWTAFAEQKSAAIHLDAGKKYYIEAFHKEGLYDDNVSVGWQGPGITGDAERPIPGTRLTPFDPAAWTGKDIGSPGQAGTQTLGAGISVDGGGADIWNTSDQFRFVYKPLVGDGEIVAKVASLENTNVWAKAGVMIRESLDANSRYAMAGVTPSSGMTFQRRLIAGAISYHSGFAGAPPRWVKITRVGNLFSGYASADGIAWSLIQNETIAMGASTWVGLAVSAHDNSTLATAAFESVNVK
jgi:M6 family metalloprotease-like protein